MKVNTLNGKEVSFTHQTQSSHQKLVNVGVGWLVFMY